MSSDNLYAFLIAAILTLLAVLQYLRSQRKKEETAKAAAEQGKTYSSGPQSQHPQIDTTMCIGCAICTKVCPEGDVLGMIGGKAVIVKGYKCIGHSLCFENCPVGA